jgi:hypothetical protein
MFLEFLGRLDAADQADALLVERALHAAHRRRRVLLAQRVHDVGDRGVVLAQRSARSSTESSRRSDPFTYTTATPSMPRNWSASTSSARREISAWRLALRGEGELHDRLRRRVDRA